jgi:hypothetical protein
MISTATTVTTTAQRILAKSNSYRTIYIHVQGAGTVYLGGSNVTSTNGMVTEKHAVPLMLEIPAQEELWAVTASGTESLRLLLPDLYNQLP